MTHNPFMLLVLLAAVVLLFMAVVSNGYKKQRIKAGQSTSVISVLLIAMTVSGIGCGLAVCYDMGLLS